MQSLYFFCERKFYALTHEKLRDTGNQPLFHTKWAFYTWHFASHLGRVLCKTRRIFLLINGPITSIHVIPVRYYETSPYFPTATTPSLLDARSRSVEQSPGHERQLCDARMEKGICTDKFPKWASLIIYC